VITLQQNQTNIFVISLTERANVGQFYMFEFESLVTKQRFRCYPTVTSVNPRFLQFGLELITTTAQAPAPLDGTLRLTPSGSWSYKLYITNEKSLTPLVFDLVQSGLVKLEGACEETPSYFFVSSNEDAAASIFLAKDCTDGCLEWTTATFWQLADQNWNCESTPDITFSNDDFTFGDDDQFFIDAQHQEAL
jgi:hypothetical protein